MRYYSGTRPRYPQRKKFPRLSLFIAAPLLLALSLALLLTVTGFFHNTDDEPDPMADDTLPGIALLKPEEAYPTGALPSGLSFDRLLLEKKKRRLTAFSRGKEVRVYLVALGANPTGHKQMEGDKRTPEGDYLINDKNPNSAYYKNLGISYPSDADRKRAQALGKPPGGDIKIHGLAPEYAFLDQAHRATDWTHGCIAVTNEEIDELFQRTPVGTPISILP